MRGPWLVIGLSLPLAGCLADRDLPGREPFFQTADTAQSLGLLTPAIAKECSEHMASDLPKIRIVGGFSISGLAAYRGIDRKPTFLPSEEGHDAVAVIAPTVSETVFGGEADSVSGCLYRLRDNHLVFEKAKYFGRRINIGRVKPDNT
jgi:hypothetical protein